MTASQLLEVKEEGPLISTRLQRSVSAKMRKSWQGLRELEHVPGPAFVVRRALAAARASGTWLSFPSQSTTLVVFCKLLSGQRPRLSGPGLGRGPSLPRSRAGAPSLTALEGPAAAHETHGAARLAAAQVGRPARGGRRGVRGVGRQGRGSPPHARSRLGGLGSRRRGAAQP